MSVQFLNIKTKRQSKLCRHSLTRLSEFASAPRKTVCIAKLVANHLCLIWEIQANYSTSLPMRPWPCLYNDEITGWKTRAAYLASWPMTDWLAGKGARWQLGNAYTLYQAGNHLGYNGVLIRTQDKAVRIIFFLNVRSVCSDGWDINYSK